MDSFQRETFYSENGFYGYDGLATFIEVFPDYNTWKDVLNTYMIFTQVEDNKNAEKIYNVIRKMYKNAYFRYGEISTAANKITERLTRLYQFIEVKEDFESKPGLTDTTTTNKSYKTNNTQDENISGYLTNEDTSTTDDSVLYMDVANKSIDKATYFNKWLTDLKTLFMNREKQVIDKDLFNKG